MNLPFSRWYPTLEERRSGGPEFTVSKRLDCGIAMMHIEVAALNCGIRGEWQFQKAPRVARFSALA